jgi:hypothetical protein
MGYLGLAEWYREKRSLNPIKEKDFLKVVYLNPKLKEIMLTIREIDKDHNGYVTRTELDDILKLYYKEHFADKDLFPIINKFSSISNKILIDYRAFKDYIRQYSMRQDELKAAALTQKALKGVIGENYGESKTASEV